MTTTPRETEITTLNALFLKRNAPRLRKFGPSFTLTFDNSGPVGIHIIQAGRRVVVASLAPDMQAARSGMVHFGFQVVRVGLRSTTKLKMREVKSLIAEYERPVEIEFQPLRTAGSVAPISPPYFTTGGESEQEASYTRAKRIVTLEDEELAEADDFDLLTPLPRAIWKKFHTFWALEPLGAPFHASFPSGVSIRLVYRKLFDAGTPHPLMVGMVAEGPHAGHIVSEIDSFSCARFRRRRQFEDLLLAPRETILTLQRVEPTGCAHCLACGSRVYLRGRHCQECGVFLATSASGFLPRRLILPEVETLGRAEAADKAELVVSRVVEDVLLNI